jgi:hypothetical protein
MALVTILNFNDASAAGADAKHIVHELHVIALTLIV